jgi:methyl-accepting chemotaxis protein
MDLNQAIEKHVEWKLKFRGAIANQETMDAETILKDNCCELGRWLHGEARTQFVNLASYLECVGKHAAFHVEAGKIAGIINSRRFSDAETMLAADSPYARASTAACSAIIRLKKEAAL